MTPPPPSYSLLPESDSPSNEKPPSLQRTPSSTPARPSSTSPSPTRYYALFLAAGISAVTLIAMLYFIPSGGSSGFWDLASMGCAGKKVNAEVGEMSMGEAEKAEVEMVTNGNGEFEKYSTTVDGKGATQTYVYTTRAIVSTNPLTAIVSISPTDPSVIFTRQVNPQGYTIGSLTGLVHQPTPTPTPASALAEIEIEDLHMRHKRGFNFEFEEEQGFEEDEEPFPTPTSFPDGREISYSVERNGETSLYEKTTRGIVNPNGFTIGQLNGAYVRVSKHEPTKRPIKLVDQHHPEYVHGELRKRDGEDA